MNLGLAGKKAIVCASSKGLGRGCALALAEAGVDLVVNGRDAATVRRTADDIAARFGVKVTPVAADVSTPEGQHALLAACPEPDILVNNNGGPPRRDFVDLTRQAMLDGVSQNMVAPIEMIQKVVGGMAERGFGRIVNITSLSVYMPISGLDLSSGARAGLTAFLAGVARAYAGRSVTINQILPGKFDTDRLRTAFMGPGKDPEAAAAALKRDIPAGRFGTAEEFGAACAFLCSVHAGYITGQNLVLDGGLYPSAF